MLDLGWSIGSFPLDACREHIRPAVGPGAQTSWLALCPRQAYRGPGPGMAPNRSRRAPGRRGWVAASMGSVTRPSPRCAAPPGGQSEHDRRPRGSASVYSPGHDSRLRRPASGRRRPLVRRTDRQPPRARPDRHDPDGLLGRWQRGDAARLRRPDAVPARGARVRIEGDVAGDRGVQPRARSRPTGRPPHSSPPGRPARTDSRPPRPTRTPRPSASGSARRGIGGPASATNRSPTSRSSTTCPRRAPSTRTASSKPRRPAT